MNMPPASPRRFQDRSSMLGAWASAGLIVVAAYVCVGTSCAPEDWETAVETPVAFDAQPSVPMRLETEVGGTVREIIIRATPGATIDKLVALPWPPPDAGAPALSAALSATALVFAAPSSGALSTPAASAPAGSQVASASPIAQPGIRPQPDGSLLIICGNSNCRALEFTVTPKTAAVPPTSVRVHADIYGTTDNCGETAPSALHVELKDLTR